MKIEQAEEPKLRFDGRTIAIDMHVAFTLDRDMADIACDGVEIARMLLDVSAKGQKYMALTVASGFETETHRVVKIRCMVNTPEQAEEMQPRVQALILQRGYPVIHCALGVLDQAFADELWLRHMAIQRELAHKAATDPRFAPN